MKRKTTISLLIALSLILLQIPASKGATDEWETDFVDEDLFIAAYPFEGVDMIYLQGDGMRIIGYYWFEGPVMQAGRYVIEAYLEVYVPSAMATDPDAIMEIYGKPSGKGGTPSYAEDPGVVNGPYTTNFYQVNLSSFVGAGTLHNITVTRILREINQGYYFWDGHDIAFVTRAHDGHDEERSIASLESGHPAKLYIHYGTPSTPGGVPAEAEFIEEYRNHTIWEVDNLGDNRTGASADVNWNLLNVTQLTEIDSGSDITVNNATWLTILDYQSQVWGCLYNDTGSANIETFFLRFKINVTNVNNVGAGNIIIPGVGGLSTSTPVGGIGLPYGASGEWAGIITWCQDDDQSWRFSMRERGASGQRTMGYSQWFDESSGNMLYVEMRINVKEATKWMSYDIYDDPEFTNSINYDWSDLIRASGPFRYPQIVPSLSGATGANIISNQYYTYLEMPVTQNNTIYVVDKNGTIVEIKQNFEGNITDIEDNIDQEVFGYPDPEDPDPPGWEDSVFTSSQFKLGLFLAGLIMFLGAPIYGFAERPEAATWILIFFMSLCGIALLWSLQTM